MNFNKAIVLGRLTRDPEQRSLPSGLPVVSFGLATSRFYTDKSGNKQNTPEFHNIVAFGKLAEICSKYLKKGGLALIEGRIQTQSWQDKEGNKKSRTEIVAESMQLGPKSAGQESSSGGTGNYQTPAKKDDGIPVIDQEAPIDNSEEDINVDNIPF
jgi:single-strand DNA-binding protein